MWIAERRVNWVILFANVFFMGNKNIRKEPGKHLTCPPYILSSREGEELLKTEPYFSASSVTLHFSLECISIFISFLSQGSTRIRYTVWISSHWIKPCQAFEDHSLYQSMHSHGISYILYHAIRHNLKIWRREPFDSLRFWWALLKLFWDMKSETFDLLLSMLHNLYRCVDFMTLSRNMWPELTTMTLNFEFQRLFKIINWKDISMIFINGCCYHFHVWSKF